MSHKHRHHRLGPRPADTAVYGKPLDHSVGSAARGEGRRLNGLFNRLAKWCAWAAGRPGAFILASGIIVVWLITGPIFAFSDTWQLVINTGTTIVTFLMVFLIQNTQNRDMAALQVKLNELIRAQGAAHNTLLDLEEMTDEELQLVRAEYLELARRAHEAIDRGETDVGSPDVRHVR